jgi:hypothetical protein
LCTVCHKIKTKSEHSSRKQASASSKVSPSAGTPAPISNRRRKAERGAASAPPRLRRSKIQPRKKMIQTSAYFT